MIKELDVFKLKQKLDSNQNLTIIDIRESSELDICKIKDTLHIPMMDIPQKMHQFDKEEELIIQCRSGSRSARVCEFLTHQGFSNVKNLKGGILDWIEFIDPSLESY
tara:strand:+ start:63 stop:383 length:321 start_codon:yes stop_codon:yes gene_type:complete